MMNIKKILGILLIFVLAMSTVCFAEGTEIIAAEEPAVTEEPVVTEEVVVTEESAATLYAVNTSVDLSTSNNFLLVPENFTITDTGSNDKITSNRNHAYSLHTTVLQKYAASNPHKPMIANVYIENAGNYNIWGYALNNVEGSGLTYAPTDHVTSNRHKYVSIGVDGSYDTNKYSSEFNAVFEWSCSSAPVYLSEGWHTIEIISPVPSAIIQYVFITDCLTLNLQSATAAGYPAGAKPSTNTEAEAAYKAEMNGYIGRYGDVAAPVAANPIGANYINESTTEIVFPTMTDASGTVICEYKVNGTTVTPDENGIYRLENLKPLAEISAEMTAKDAFGNENKITYADIAASINPLPITLVTNGGTTVATMADVLGATTVTAQVNFVNKENATKPITMIAGIYTSDKKRMVASTVIPGTVAITSAAQSISAPITIPSDVAINPENYLIFVEVWNDDASLSPYMKGVIIGQGE